jgi:hypothetical protein
MRRVFVVALGVMTAIGGFVDVGNLVTSGITGARFGMSLTWAIVLGTIAMTLYGEMAGRVAAVARRPVFHIIRERLGVRTALANLSAFVLLSLLTLAAEIGGVALVLELVTGINYLVWVPLVGAAVWLIVWRMSFSLMENLFGVLGLCLVVFVVALFVLPTDWGSLWHGATHPWVPPREGHPMYLFYAVSLFGACLVPYQVVFVTSIDDTVDSLYESGSVRWTRGSGSPPMNCCWTGRSSTSTVSPWARSTALLRRLVRDSVLVDWAQIATLGIRHIDLAVRRDQLRRLAQEESGPIPVASHSFSPGRCSSLFACCLPT